MRGSEARAVRFASAALAGLGAAAAGMAAAVEAGFLLTTRGSGCGRSTAAGRGAANVVPADAASGEVATTGGAAEAGGKAAVAAGAGVVVAGAGAGGAARPGEAVVVVAAGLAALRGASRTSSAQASADVATTAANAAPQIHGRTSDRCAAGGAPRRIVWACRSGTWPRSRSASALRRASRMYDIALGLSVVVRFSVRQPAWTGAAPSRRWRD